MNSNSIMTVALWRVDRHEMEVFKVIAWCIKELEWKIASNTVLEEIQLEFAKTVAKVSWDIESTREQLWESMKIWIEDMEKNIKVYVDERFTEVIDELTSIRKEQQLLEKKIPKEKDESKDIESVKASIRKINWRLLSVSKFMKKHGS